MSKRTKSLLISFLGGFLTVSFLRSRVSLDLSSIVYWEYLVAAAIFVAAIQFVVRTLLDDYPPARDDVDFDNRLEEVFLKKDKDGIIVFREWVNTSVWLLTGVTIFLGMWLSEISVATYLLGISVLLLIANYLLYIRKKAYKRQVSER